MPEEKEHALSKRLNKILETRFENDQVFTNSYLKLASNLQLYSY